MSLTNVLTLMQEFVKCSAELKTWVSLIRPTSANNDFTKIESLLNEIIAFANEYKIFSRGELKSVMEAQPTELRRRLDAEVMSHLAATIIEDVRKAKSWQKRFDQIIQPPKKGTQTSFEPEYEVFLFEPEVINLNRGQKAFAHYCNKIENEIEFIEKLAKEMNEFWSERFGKKVSNEQIIFTEITAFERDLRSFIEENLRTFFGDGWIRKAVPKNTRDDWTEKREKDLKQGKTPEENLINYADFSAYKEIIIYNWKNIFSTYFQDKEELRVRLDDLNNLLRTSTMHARTISDDAIGTGRWGMQWLRAKMIRRPSTA